MARLRHLDRILNLKVIWIKHSCKSTTGGSKLASTWRNKKKINHVAWSNWLILFENLLKRNFFVHRVHFVRGEGHRNRSVVQVYLDPKAMPLYAQINTRPQVAIIEQRGKTARNDCKTRFSYQFRIDIDNATWHNTVRHVSASTVNVKVNVGGGGGGAGGAVMIFREKGELWTLSRRCRCFKKKNETATAANLKSYIQNKIF